jgi:hypothetical protein
VRYVYPQTMEDAWYEAYADAVHSLGKKWPDPLTDEQATWCESVANQLVGRPVNWP